MNLKLSAFFLVFIIGMLGMASVALAQESLNTAQIVKIILSTDPDLIIEDINVGMIKSLHGRYKVNVTISDNEAVAYFTYQIYKGEKRWWFEKNPEESIVYTGKGKTVIIPIAEVEEAATGETSLPGPEESAPQTSEIVVESASPVENTLALPEEENEESEAVVEEIEVAELPKPEMDIGSSTRRATGPNGDVRQYVIALINTLAKGDSSQYANFLYRPSEVTKNVREKDYRKGLATWEKQFNDVHLQFRAVSTINISQILLHSPQNSQIAATTIDQIKRSIRNVEEVITTVDVTLETNVNTKILKLGGLVRTPGGWRISGTVSLVEK